jgi:hypothetical protein
VSLKPDIDLFVSEADIDAAVAIGNVLKRGITSKEKIASVLVAYAFDLVKDDLRGQIHLLHEILQHNRNLRATKEEVE